MNFAGEDTNDSNVAIGQGDAVATIEKLKNGEKANPDEQAGDADIFTGVGGVIYVTGNSASGRWNSCTARWPAM